VWLEARNFAGVVTDLDTGLPVRKVIRVNPEKGLVEAFKIGPDGAILRVGGVPQRYKARGRFKVEVVRRVPHSKTPLMGAPECRCGSRMTLPGDDLCHVCRAKEQGRVIRVEPVSGLATSCQCDNNCGRPATWSVSDETAVTPVIGDYPQPGGPPVKVAYLRAALVQRWWYCSWCYRPPRILDARGEVMSVIEDAGGVRPN
jgi:hypothetical protein